MTLAPRARVAFLAAIALVGAGLVALAWFALPTQQGFVALAVIATAGAMAVWRRPPAADASGRRLRPTSIVNAALVIGIGAIPIGLAGAGLTGGRSAATVVLGIGFAVFGLGAFALYSLTWALTKRAAPAAAMALAVAGAVAVWLTAPAFLDQLAGRNPF